MAEVIDVPRIPMHYFFMSTSDEEAKCNPVIEVIDETICGTYARTRGKKRAGHGGELDWLLQDMVE